MATGVNADLTLSVRFASNQLPLYVKQKDTVEYVIKKAAAALKEDREGMVLFFKGTRLNERDNIGDAIGRDPVTVLHIQKVSNVSARSSEPTIYVGPTKQQLEPLTGFCRGECGNLLCSLAPVFQCSNCRQEDGFIRYQNDVPIDFFGVDITVKQLMGKCSVCRKEQIAANVKYQCKACEGMNVPFLRQVRHNIHNRPCMKCEETQDTIFVFSCSSRHTMCLGCFSNMCKIQLNSNHFKQFPMMGYSVRCPGTGADCADTPVADPHHFYLIDSVGECYTLFKDKSIENFQPAGDNIFCCCKNEIDVGSGTPVDVTPPPQPETQQASVGGGMWFLKRLFQRAPPPPKPVERKTRRQVSCRKCQKNYCVECKQFWHEGECQAPANDDLSQHYQIDPKKAAASCWLQQ